MYKTIVNVIICKFCSSTCYSHEALVFYIQQVPLQTDENANTFQKPLMIQLSFDNQFSSFVVLFYIQCHNTCTQFCINKIKYN